ncbi:MAG: toxin-antitoxin system, toxin component [Candidatus Melainabacteria bacterium GWF2_37_15]|nr:MAG: toxin-antitoxin system, toxin component [Candidatus Melainabacteria bacterium GWF2_37_15]
MEKKKSHYNLSLIKKLIRLKQYRITITASDNAEQYFGLRGNDVIEEILNLETNNFYKSMTSHNNHKIWQDVYHKPIESKIAYIKLQIIDEKTVVIQFKEK